MFKTANLGGWGGESHNTLGLVRVLQSMDPLAVQLPCLHTVSVTHGWQKLNQSQVASYLLCPFQPPEHEGSKGRLLINTVI